MGRAAPQDVKSSQTRDQEPVSPVLAGDSQPLAHQRSYHCPLKTNTCEVCRNFNAINIDRYDHIHKAFGVLNNFEEYKGDVEMGKTLLYPLLYSAI